MKRSHVKATAMKMVKENGLINLSRKDLCEQSGIPDGSFPHVMGCSFFDFLMELESEGVEQNNAPVNKSRVNAVMRREQLLRVATDLAKKNNYSSITRDEIARSANVSTGLITKYFGTMTKLRRDIMRLAIKQSILEIIAQGLVNSDRHAKKAPPELRERAAALIANA